MKTGAVIVAAGMSSRMGAFKPMLQIGSISVAKRIISTLQQSGAELVVVVTGNQADMLEKHLAKSGAVFVRNENYATTQMFDSAKIGLEYIKDKCDRVLFTPVDLPLFTAQTVSCLLEQDADFAVPVCNGAGGHPIMLKNSIIDSILSYEGKAGLRGALEYSGATKQLVMVHDEGILFDMDTPSDYEELVKRHNSQLLRPILSLRLAREQEFFGPEEARLLRLIRETGSVKTACSRLKLSYSKGWKTLQQISDGVGARVVDSNQGGPDGGSSSLTEKGEWLLERFSQFEALCRQFVEESFDKHFSD
ncbi:MAG: NTP transferase domain-containing protein [Oscillospiraceae bacterium]|nr:NTP transferase domain-containing protein [Oscillospiraceae bacterium]